MDTIIQEKNYDDKISNHNIETFDITNIHNDFIYRLIDYYLDEISLEPSYDINSSITNLVDTLMSYYLLAQKNGVIDVPNSRKILMLKMYNNSNIGNNNLLGKCKQLNGEFEQLEKYLIDKNQQTNLDETKNKPNKPNKIDSTDNITYDIPQIDDLIKNHGQFMSKISEQLSDIYNNTSRIRDKIDNSDDTRSTPEVTIDKITSLENKLKTNIKTVGTTLQNNLQTRNNIPQSDIDTAYPIHIQTNNSNPKFVNILDTEEKNIIKKFSQDISNKGKHMDKLNEAFKQLYLRLNTPIINLIITIIILKIAVYLIGF